MDYIKIFKMLKNLEGLVKWGEVECKENIPYKKYGMGKDAINIIGEEALVQYSKVAKYLLNSDHSISDTVTLADIEDEIILLLRKAKKEELSIEMIKVIFSKLRKQSIKEYEVFYPLYGVVYCKEEPIQLGPFTIYNFEIHREFLLKKYPKSDFAFKLKYDEVKLKDNQVLLISVVVSARNHKSANEKGRVKLRGFEDAIRFMVADLRKHYDVGVFNYNSYRWTDGIIVSSDEVSTSAQGTGAMSQIFLNQHQVVKLMSQNGNDRIWSLLAKSNLNDMEQRIISAIKWAGKALRDEEPARAFIQYMFAFEALLQFQQRGQLVSPSITYQISEFVAFIVNESLDDRIRTEKMIKDLYGKRSTIVHGGSTEVSEDELSQAFSLLKNIIVILLVHEEFKDIKSIQHLNEWVKKQKYS
ncbi:HEPN domain-containing protein [Bacillus cereus]|nr:HEPN domain-containing protein [Bacillus cereus]MDA2207826.1 HEPN domain-containing protein [Bacillus cereus]MDA2754342.1 HEPN domain-containing protein [Bacillus cereus]